MRVIAGSAKGRRLITREGPQTRPTLDRLKETLFAVMQFEAPGSRFLDLFSGSGAIGIEALSRGARSAVLVENSPEAVRCIESNLASTGFSGQAVLMRTDVLEALSELGRRGERFDIIFMDPPYDRGYEQKTLDRIVRAGVLAPDGLIVVESSVHTTLDLAGTDLRTEKIKDYRVTKLTFLRGQ